MCLLAKKTIGVISAGAGAAIIIVVAVYFGMGGVAQSTTHTNSTGMMQGPVFVQNNDAGTYKINSECELIYGLAVGAYPDGSKLPGVKIDSLLTDYPEEFKPWKELLQNPDNRTVFFNKPLPADFRGVLTVGLMKESSINPKLEQIAMIITDPDGKAKLQQAFQEYQCQKYFDERQKK